jgi:glutathione S-transferase
MNISLHFFAPSIFCQKVLLACCEKGIKTKLIHYDLFTEAGEEMVDSLTPWGRLPVMDAEGARYCESSSIIEFLEVLDESRSLIPKSPLRAAEVRHFDRIVDTYLSVQLGKLFHHSFGLHRPFSDVAIRAISGQIRETLLWLDSQVQGRPFAVGDEFSIADCSLIAALEHCEPSKLFAGLENLSDYYRRSERLSGVQLMRIQVAAAIGSDDAYGNYRKALSNRGQMRV